MPTAEPTAASFVLPAILNLQAAAGLRDDLLARRGTPLALDASEVEQAGGQCLQVLIAAAKLWRADSKPLTYSMTSPQFDARLALMGADLAMLSNA